MKNLPSWFSDILHWLMLKAREYHLVEPAAQTLTTPLALDVQFIAIDAREYATVVIPALNEAKRIAEVVAFALVLIPASI